MIPALLKRAVIPFGSRDDMYEARRDASDYHEIISMELS